LAYFLAELSGFPEEIGLHVRGTYVACVDGSSTRKRSGAIVVLVGPYGEDLEFAIKLAFATTNNEVEYEAIIAGMEVVRELEAKNLKVRSDSHVVMGHIMGEYEAGVESMKWYLSKVHEIWTSLKNVLMMRVPWEDNTRADFLAKP